MEYAEKFENWGLCMLLLMHNMTKTPIGSSKICTILENSFYPKVMGVFSKAMTAMELPNMYLTDRVNYMWKQDCIYWVMRLASD